MEASQSSTGTIKFSSPRAGHVQSSHERLFVEFPKQIEQVLNVPTNLLTDDPAHGLIAWSTLSISQGLLGPEHTDWLRFADRVGLRIKYNTAVSVRKKRRALYLFEVFDQQSPRRSWLCKMVR